jgi:hypothetical protein
LKKKERRWMVDTVNKKNLFYAVNKLTMQCVRKMRLFYNLGLGEYLPERFQEVELRLLMH